MGHSDLLGYAVRSLTHRGLRSWLTILGIVIGIAAIVALISISQGLDGYIRGQLGNFGSDIISVAGRSPEGLQGMGPFMSATTNYLTDKEVKLIDPLPGVKKAYGIMGTRGKIDFRGESGETAVASVDVGLFKEFDRFIQFTEGKAFSASDTGVVVIGEDLAEDAFDEEISLNRELRINGKSFRVVGIMNASSGTIFDTGSLVFMPVSDFRNIYGSQRAPGQLDVVVVKLEPDADPAFVGSEIERTLRNHRKEKEGEETFRVNTPESIGESVSSITDMLNLFLGGIAGISLVVGGIGIANTMFMSVVERTREIGILKALGAPNNAIMELFLIESGLIGVGGGIIGILIGYVLSFIMVFLGVPSAVTIELVLFALFFSFAVGAISGFFPARQAAGLQPVEAMGFE